MEEAMRRTGLAIALLLVTGADGYAQGSDRAYAQGIGGVTFGTEPTHMFGGGFGVSVRRYMRVIVEGGRINDVVPNSVREPWTMRSRKSAQTLASTSLRS
jgi:hypothetical protein